MSKKKNGSQQNAHTKRLIQEMVRENYRNDTDPQGSYTGKPVDPEEIPAQDADDLSKRLEHSTHRKARRRKDCMRRLAFLIIDRKESRISSGFFVLQFLPKPDIIIMSNK